MSKKTRKIKKKLKENIKNIPNFLTLLRVILTFIILYYIFAGFSMKSVVVLFVIGMATDGLDGYIARKYKQKTEFGRKFDMLADRFLLFGTVFGIIIYNTQKNLFNGYELLFIFLILTREIISFPFAVTAFLSSKTSLPRVRLMGKLTTFSQLFALPMILLKWDFAVYFVILTALFGIIAGAYYMYDTLKLQARPIEKNN